MAVLAVGCSVDTGDENAAPSDEIVAIDGLPEPEDEPVTITVPDEPLEPADPVTRTAANDAPIEATNWVARTFMDDTRVDVVWSPVDNAENYRLYVVPTAQADYAAIATGDLGDADLVYEGAEFGFVDGNAEADTFLTYILVAEVGDCLLYTSPSPRDATLSRMPSSA